MKRNAAGRFEGPAEGAKKSVGGAKRAMQTKVKAAWPDITDKLVETAKQGDFRATKWLWDECGLGVEMPKKRRGEKSGFAQTLIDEFKRQQAMVRGGDLPGRAKAALPKTPDQGDTGLS